MMNLTKNAVGSSGDNTCSRKTQTLLRSSAVSIIQKYLFLEQDMWQIQ